MSIAVLGSKTTCLRLLEAMGSKVDCVVTIDDRADGRTRLVDIEQQGRSLGIPTRIAASASAAYEALESLGPDVVFVAGWYHLIAPSILDRPRHGFVGVHYSALPAYRGSSPVVWAMINGERTIGYSLFRLTADMDEGPLAAQGLVEVDDDDDVAMVLDRLDAASIAAFVALADDLAAGRARFTPQRATGVSYAGARREEDGRIDWTWPAEQIARFIRAQTRPYPGAFTTLDGERVRVWAARVAPTPCFGIPGQVIHFDRGNPVVACGAGSGLALTDVESPVPVRFSLVRTRFGAPAGIAKA